MYPKLADLLFDGDAAGARRWLAAHPRTIIDAAAFGLAVRRGSAAVQVLLDALPAVKPARPKDRGFALMEAVLYGTAEVRGDAYETVFTGHPLLTHEHAGFRTWLGTLRSAFSDADAYADGLHCLVRSGDLVAFDTDAALCMAVISRSSAAEHVLREFRPDGFSERFRAVMTGNIRVRDMTEVERVFRDQWKSFLRVLTCRSVRGEECPEFRDILVKLNELAGSPVIGEAGFIDTRTLDRYSDTLLITLMELTQLAKSYGKERLLRTFIAEGREAPLQYALDHHWAGSWPLFQRLAQYSAEINAPASMTAAILAAQQSSGLKAPKPPSLNPFSVENMRRVWSFRVLDDGTLEITGYKGTGGKPAESVSVPSVIGRRTVSAIDSAAFSPRPYVSVQACAGRRAIRHLTIPGTIRRIPADFLKNHDSIRSVSLLDGVETIEDGAFCFCRYLHTIELPDSLTRISAAAGLGSDVLNALRSHPASMAAK